MRIIAGKYRGRRLVCPRGFGTRPITDRVKQALFSSLGSRYNTPGQLPELYILDLFSGPGSFGLEALSRGAGICCFVEKDRAALGALKQNINELELGGKCWIVSGDAFNTDLPQPPGSQGWELAFVDPPYSLGKLAATGDPVPLLMGRLADQDILAREATVILRHPASTKYQNKISSLVPRETRIYGSMGITWFYNER